MSIVHVDPLGAPMRATKSTGVGTAKTDKVANERCGAGCSLPLRIDAAALAAQLAALRFVSFSMRVSKAQGQA